MSQRSCRSAWPELGARSRRLWLLAAATSTRARAGALGMLVFVVASAAPAAAAAAPAAAAAAPAAAKAASAAAPAPAPTSPAGAGLSDRLGACIGRDDPDCIEAILPELQRVAGDGAALTYARGTLAMLRGDDAGAARLLESVAAMEGAPPALRRRARELGVVAAQTAEAIAQHRKVMIAGGRFALFVAPGPDEVLVGLMDEVLGRAVPALEAALGALPSPPVRVLVYPRVETLAATTGLTVAQIRTSGTIAVCKYNRLMITSPADLVFGYPWADTVVHELVHLLVTRRAGAGVPIWLHEAIARSYERIWRGVAPDVLDDDELAALQAARRRGRFITLRQMSPSMAALPSQEAAQLAFAEVHHILGYLERRAKQPLRALLERFATGEDEAEALEAWLGEKQSAAVADWMKALRRGDGLPEARAVAAAPTLQFRRAKAKRRAGRGSDAAQRHIELGDRLLAIGRPAAAVLEYRKGVGAGAADDLLMWTRMARALVDLARFDEAEAVLGPALARHPQHAPLLLLDGRVAAGRGDHARARARALDSARINPYDPGVHRLGASACEALGDADEAARWRDRLRLVAVESARGPAATPSLAPRPPQRATP